LDLEKKVDSTLFTYVRQVINFSSLKSVGFQRSAEARHNFGRALFMAYVYCRLVPDYAIRLIISKELE
jgi:hypothetical protein